MRNELPFAIRTGSGPRERMRRAASVIVTRVREPKAGGRARGLRRGCRRAGAGAWRSTAPMSERVAEVGDSREVRGPGEAALVAVEAERRAGVDRPGCWRPVPWWGWGRRCFRAGRAGGRRSAACR